MIDEEQGRDKRMRGMDRVKLAFIGCGDVAQRDYLPELHRIQDRVELVAVCGRGEERARAVAEAYGFQAWYADYRQMLADTEADAVVNLTPMQMHFETNLAALRAGKHVYTEKPVATRVAEVRQLQAEAERQDRKLVCAPCVMLFPQVRTVGALLAEGAIGPVHSAGGAGHGGVPPWHGYTSDPSQFFTPGGGPAFDMGVYPLHALTGLLGPALQVMALTGRVLDRFTVPDGPAAGQEVPVTVDDNWHIVLDFGAARLAAVDATNCVRDSRVPQMELRGLEGTIAANLLDVSAPLEVVRKGQGWESIPLPRTGRASGPDHLLGVEHLLDCIQHGREPVLSVEHALHVVEIIEKAAQSAVQGQTLALESTF
jgi:predicted dehydrogenase